MDQRIFWYWLNGILNLSKGHIWKLIDYFQSPRMIYEASEDEIIQACSHFKIGIENLKLLTKPVRLENLRTSFKKYADLGIKTYCPDDDGFVNHLGHLHNPPCFLFYKGRLPEVSKPSIAIVGSRDCSAYGYHMAEHMAYQLTKAGVQVISGLARGIDTAAHSGALRAYTEIGEAASVTVGVLGSGIDICYPVENRQLFYKMYQSACVMTEYPLGCQPLARNFPARNRIISALADGILVVEAKASSGSLITAHMGLEQGKDIYAIPGRTVDALSIGSNKLIQAGAKMVLEPKDILDELGMKYISSAETSIDLSEEQRLLLKNITYDAITLDELSKHTNIKLSDINLDVMKLELKGLIRRLPNNSVVKRCDS